MLHFGFAGEPNLKFSNFTTNLNSFYETAR